MERKLRNWIQSYMQYTIQSEAPDVFHKYTAIATIAGALRRKVWYDMGLFVWYPNFFMFFVAPAGIVSKSTTVSLGMDLLKEIPGVKFGPSVVTWQALVAALEDAQEDFLIGDVYYPMAPLIIAASELGTFLDPKNREMVDVLVDLWDGKQGAWEKQTKTGTSERIENPWITVLGCTTPSWIAENFSDYFFGGGLASRSVLVYGDQKRRLIAYPKKHFESGREELKAALLTDLEQISMLAGPYHLTPAAEDWGEAWYEKHWNDPHTHIEGEKFAAYWARKQTHVHKIAMILSAAESNELIITKDHLELAVKEISELEKAMPKVYGKMGRETEVKHMQEIRAVLAANSIMEKTKLYAQFMDNLSYNSFESALKSLAQAGQVRILSNPEGVFITLAGEKTT